LQKILVLLSLQRIAEEVKSMVRIYLYIAQTKLILIVENLSYSYSLRMFSFNKVSFLDFPLACSNFEPPLSVDCHASLFEEAGCLKDGSDYPPNIEGWHERELLNIE